MISLRQPLTSKLMHLSSGPHHGHYVSIVKAGGLWKLFDDDHVETIKESDIPKYFGDSNFGSAYVLYYQAVDINLTSLGLRPPAPDPVPVSVAPDDGQTPTLPPGLTTEHDSSDLAESSGPTTPAPSNPTYSPKINSSPTHSKPNLPPHDLPPPPPIPQQPPQKSQGGLFHSLRHVPSVKIRGHGSEKLEAFSVSTNSSTSGSTSSPANGSSHQLLQKFEVIPGSPLVEPTSPKSNGVGKDKWYRRKGTKDKGKEKGSTHLLKAPLSDKRPNTAPGKQSDSLAPPSPASTIDSSSQRSTSPSHPHSEPETKGEKSPVSSTLTRKPSAPVSRHSPSNSRSTPSFADDIPAVPPLPPFSSSPTVQVHRTRRPLQFLPSIELPQRRATVVGGGDTSQKNNELNGHAKSNGDLAGRNSKPRPSSLHANMMTSSTSSELLTPTPERPFEVTDPPMNADSSTAMNVTGHGGVGTHLRNAKRKLSLTIGLVRKEKHKEKLGGIPQGPT